MRGPIFVLFDKKCCKRFPLKIGKSQLNNWMDLMFGSFERNIIHIQEETQNTIIRLRSGRTRFKSPAPKTIDCQPKTS